MRICFIQAPYPSIHNNLKPIDVMEFMLDEIRQINKPVDLLVLPEYSNCPGILNKEELIDFHDKYTLNFINEVSDHAKEKGTNIAVNILTAETNSLMNVTLLFDRSGKQQVKYQKTHLTATELSLGLIPGNNLITYDLQGIKLAFATCFEIYFAEYFEKIASLQPDILIFPTYQRSEDSHIIKAQTAGRAIDLDAFIVRSSYSIGKNSDTGGNSMIVSPSGNILVNAKQRTGTFEYEIDPREKRLRSEAYSLPQKESRQIIEDNRRPKLYRISGPDTIGGKGRHFPVIIAHRGLSATCPENTMPAFGAAAAIGADEIELDIWGSKNRQLVVCHDSSIDRTSDKSGEICDLCWNEIKCADAGRWFDNKWSDIPFPGLDDVFKKYGGRIGMNIHIKAPGEDGWIVKKVVESIREYSLKDHVYIAGTRDVLEYARMMAPDIRRCCLEGQHDMTIVENAILYECSRLQFVINCFDLEMIDKAHNHGIICNLFWVDEPDIARKFFNMGIDAILTNNANLILPVLNDFKVY